MGDELWVFLYVATSGVLYINLPELFTFLLSPTHTHKSPIPSHKTNSYDTTISSN